MGRMANIEWTLLLVDSSILVQTRSDRFKQKFHESIKRSFQGLIKGFWAEFYYSQNFELNVNRHVEWIVSLKGEKRNQLFYGIPNLLIMIYVVHNDTTLILIIRKEPSFSK